MTGRWEAGVAATCTSSEEPGHEKHEQESARSQGLLDVVAENHEERQISDQMQPAAVQEERCQDALRQVDRIAEAGDFRR